MKAAYLALVALLVGSTAVAASSVAGYGSLAYITYHIINTNEGNITIVPANINLGNLTPGEKGNVTVNASVTLSKTDNYTIMLLHLEKLKKDFSEFKAIINIGNKTITIDLDHPFAVLQLSNGTYQVHITIVYQVSQNPSGDLNVNNEPLLIIHPGVVHKDDHHEHHGHHHDNGNDDQGDDDRGDG